MLSPVCPSARGSKSALAACVRGLEEGSHGTMWTEFCRVLTNATAHRAIGHGTSLTHAGYPAAPAPMHK